MTHQLWELDPCDHGDCVHRFDPVPGGSECRYCHRRLDDVVAAANHYANQPPNNTGATQ
ncbi:MAG: hypothetical protein AAF531_10440 [Actinomycetota bacterium]